MTEPKNNEVAKEDARLMAEMLAGCHGCAVCSRALRPAAARLLNGATVAPAFSKSKDP